MKEIPPRALACEKRGSVRPKRIIHSPIFILSYKSMRSHELAYPVRPFSRRESIVNCQNSTLGGIVTVLKFLFFGAAVVVGTMSLPSESRASEWGCQVLLCLSGDWQGTPSCHPPIYKLIAAMKEPGFNWPICPQANSSGARYEPYENCPEGWTPYSPITDEHGQRHDASMCRSKSAAFVTSGIRSRNGGGDRNNGYRTATVKIGDQTVQAHVTTVSDGGHGNRSTTYYEISRPKRAKPYYIEYDDANGVRQRSWFNLNRP